MAKITWALSAIADLGDIAKYISRDSEMYANTLVSKLIESTERLKNFPRSGRIVPEFNDPTIRELIVQNYRIVYHIENQQIGIVAIVHGSRVLPGIFRKRKTEK